MTTPNINTAIATGQHYKKISIPSWAVGQALDPLMINLLYTTQDKPLSAGQFTILKKVLALGKRGNKSEDQDLHDIIGACNRMLELNALATGGTVNHVRKFQ